MKKKSKNKPKNKKALPVYLTPEARKWVDDLSDKEGRSSTYIVSTLIEEKMKIIPTGQNSTRGVL